MATFGDTGTTGGTSGQNSGTIVVCKFTLAAPDAFVSKLTIRITGAGSGSQAIRGVIYANSAGVPGARLALGSEVILDGTIGVSTAYDLPFASELHLTAADYFLGGFWGATNTRGPLLQVAGAANQVAYRTGLTYPTAPDPFSTPTGQLAWIMRVFATYTLPPLTITDYAAAVFTSASGTKAQTVVPAVGDLIVVVVAHTGNTSGTAPTDDNPDGLGTYTEAVSVLKAASADRMGIWVRNALVGSATSTIITTAPGATSGGGLRSFKVVGSQRAGAAAIRQVAGQSDQGAGTPAPVFPGVALTTNGVVGAIFNADNPATMTPPTFYTENGDVGYNTPTTGLEMVRRDGGETGTTITWGSASGTAFASAILELDASPPLAAAFLQQAVVL